MLKGIQLLSEKSGIFKKCCLSLILNHLLIYSEFVKLAGLARNSKVYQRIVAYLKAAATSKMKLVVKIVPEG